MSLPQRPPSSSSLPQYPRGGGQSRSHHQNPPSHPSHYPPQHHDHQQQQQQPQYPNYHAHPPPHSAPLPRQHPTADNLDFPQDSSRYFRPPPPGLPTHQHHHHDLQLPPPGFRQQQQQQDNNHHHPSLPQHPPPAPPPPSSSSKRRRAESPKATTAVDDSADANGTSNIPSVLVREKKQKACAACRRAKLKCIVEEGEVGCVRCKARKEKCVFYPRSHDDDWQQSLTSDVYTALSHLSSLTSAVSHVLTHLVQTGTIPPLAQPLEAYEAPERDMSMLQGWSAEKNRELPEETANRKGSASHAATDERPKAKKRSRDDEAADEVPTVPPPLQTAPPRPMSFLGNESFQHQQSAHPQQQQQPDEYALLRPLMHGAPSSTSASSEEAAQYSRRPPPHSPLKAHHRFSAPDLPYWRQGDPQTIDIPPTMDVHAPPPPGSSYLPQQPVYPQHTQHAFSHQPVLAPPARSSDPSPPTSIQQITPTSMPTSSPLIDHTPFTASASTQTLPTSTSPDDPIVQDVAGVVSQVYAPKVDEEGEPVIGSADGRANVITKQIVPALDAKRLVRYFHAHLAPNIYGYSLRPGLFPYLPDPPTATTQTLLTPFIFGVECLLASERIPSLYRYHAPLVDEVLALLQQSPAESWTTFATANKRGENGVDELLGMSLGGEVEVQASSGGRRARGGDGEVRKAEDEGSEESLDPELAIGPEEIVGAATLACYIGLREEAGLIASGAFKWARGWIKLLKDKPVGRVTLAEGCGYVPAERKATDQEMARVWLLCYIIDSTESLLRSGARPPNHDPIPYINTLLPLTCAPPASLPSNVDASPFPSDVVLTRTAHLISTLTQWQHRLHAMHPLLLSDPARYMAMHKRLTTSLNSSLTFWKYELDGWQLAKAWTRQVEVYWHFARVTVNARVVGELSAGGVGAGGGGGGADEGFREASRGEVLDHAVQLLERCAEWEPKEELISLPSNYFSMMTAAGGQIVENLREVYTSRRGGRGMVAVTPGDVIPLLTTVSGMLALGGLPEGHGARWTSRTLRQYAEDLSSLR